MPSSNLGSLTAEQRFRQAFERLKANTLNILKPGTPVSQNNVAREAGCDPSALRKSRFPALIREIQAYIELKGDEVESCREKKNRKRKTRRTKDELLKDVTAQRDAVQSALLCANERIVELSREVHNLNRRLDEATHKRSN